MNTQNVSVIFFRSLLTHVSWFVPAVKPTNWPCGLHLLSVKKRTLLFLRKLITAIQAQILISVPTSITVPAVKDLRIGCMKFQFHTFTEVCTEILKLPVSFIQIRSMKFVKNFLHLEENPRHLSVNQFLDVEVMCLFQMIFFKSHINM